MAIGLVLFLMASSDFLSSCVSVCLSVGLSLKTRSTRLMAIGLVFVIVLQVALFSSALTTVLRFFRLKILYCVFFLGNHLNSVFFGNPKDQDYQMLT